MNKYKFIKKNGKLVPEHRVIAEKILKRKLKKEERIHHKDFNKSNNDSFNLMLFESQASHKSFENKYIKFGLTRPIMREIIKRSII